MKSIHIKDAQYTLLESILQDYSLDVQLVRSRQGEIECSDDQIAVIVDGLVMAFTTKGLRPDGEPNDIGIAIEDLIDLFNPYSSST
tara:strand:+ start:164 stop:421 length:258 start_codon:yes stop_codon:yes gene_type:complete